MIEKDVESSCDIGINAGDEWVLFATAHNGRLSISACNRNVRYRDKDGVRDWHYGRGMQEMEDLRVWYGRSQKRQPDGVNRQYYPDGKIEIEETYLEVTLPNPGTTMPMAGKSACTFQGDRDRRREKFSWSIFRVI